MISENTSNHIINDEGEWADPNSEISDGLNMEETHNVAQKTRFFTRTALGGIKIRPRTKHRSTRVVL